MNLSPLFASIFVSLTLGVGGMIILCKGTNKARKKHTINVFAQNQFALLFMGCLVRACSWIMWAWPGTTLSEYPKDGA